jgi:DNA-binding transcriptional MerR regulator
MIESINSVDLEQRHIIKFLRIKGFNLGEIAKELSNALGLDAYTPASMK